MAKWTSVLFSDIRNKVANQVVFSSWKGRGYMRAYAVPANPQTKKQLAQRAMMKEAEKRAQAIIGDADSKTAWNVVALALQISGANLIAKYVSGSTVTATGGDEQVTVTGKTNIPLSNAYVAAFKTSDDSFAKKTKINTAEFTDVVIPDLVNATEYYIGLMRDDVITGDVFDEFVCMWKKNEATGTADIQKITPSA